MPGKIVWNIEFTGLDESLKKLKEIDRILQSISRHQGTSILGAPGTGTPNAGGRNVFVPPRGGGHTGGSAALGAAAGGALEALLLAKLIKPTTTPGVYDIEDDEKVRKLFKLKNIKNPLGFGMGPEGSGQFRYGDNTSGPPFLHKPYSQIISDWMAGKGGQPFKVGMGEIGTRASNVPKLPSYDDIIKHLQKFGKAMEATGIPGLTQFGGMLTKITKLQFEFGLVVAAAAALYAAFKLLIKGVEESSRIYQLAAQTGIGVNKTSQLEQALKSMGITERPTFQMESAMRGGASSAGIIGAARGSGFGGAQQLQNMSKEFAEAMKDAAYSSGQMELSAKAGQLLFMDMTAIGREFKTLLAQYAADLYPVLHAFMEAVKDILKILNLYMELLLKMEQWVNKKLGLNLFPTGSPGTSRWPGAGGGGLPGAGSWEKIGLVFGKGGFSTAMEQTAKNTKDTATNTNKMIDLLKMAFKLSAFPFGGLAPSFAP